MGIWMGLATSAPTEVDASLIGTGAALLVGAAGFVTALVANSRAKKANVEAEKANRIAAEALATAKDANQIAENANDLSEQANTIAKDQAAKMVDPAHIEWTVEWDPETASVVATNTGRDHACDVSVLVQGKDVRELVRSDSYTAEPQEVRVPIPNFIERRSEFNLAEVESYERRRGGPVFMMPRKYSQTFNVDIRWQTAAGNPGSETVELKAR
jgi:hypothetical protein